MCARHNSAGLLTIFTRAQTSPWQLEEGGTQLQQQDVGMVVLIYKQDTIHASPNTFLSVPVTAV
jgi:hypothetical protein